MAEPVFAAGDVPTASQVNEWFVNVNWARKPVNESVTSSTTLQSDDHLFVPVQANAAYFMTCVIKYDGDSAGDIKVLFRLPTSATLNGLGNTLIGGAASQSDNQNVPYVENASNIWGCLGTGTTLYGMVSGLVLTSSTAGTVSVEWAQNTSSATATRVLIGSFLDLARRE